MLAAFDVGGFWFVTAIVYVVVGIFVFMARASDQLTTEKLAFTTAVFWPLYTVAILIHGLCRFAVFAFTGKE